MNDWHWGFGFGHWIFGILFWVIVVLLVVLLVRAVAGGFSTGGQGVSALELLKRRYARGEIDREEYERKRRELE